MTSAWLPRVGKLRLMPILDPRPVFGCTWYRCLSLYGVVLSCVLLASSFEEWLPAYNCRESLVMDGRSSGSMDVWIISFSLTYPGPGISGDTGSCAICSILGTCSLMQGVSFLWGDVAAPNIGLHALPYFWHQVHQSDSSRTVPLHRVRNCHVWSTQVNLNKQHWES